MSKRSERERYKATSSTSHNRKRSPRRFLCHRITKTIVQKKEIKKAIKQENKDKKGLNSCFINCMLYNVPNFIGCFSQDQLQTLVIRSLPVSLIVNLDTSSSSGSHWIALRIAKKTLEIFDPLGFNVSKWPGKIPYFLFQFLHKFSVHRRVLISREIQPDNSTLCGFYCIFFLYYRLTHTFHDCTKPFSRKQLRKNDIILQNLF